MRDGFPPCPALGLGLKVLHFDVDDQMIQMVGCSIPTQTVIFRKSRHLWKQRS